MWSGSERRLLWLTLNVLMERDAVYLVDVGAAIGSFCLLCGFHPDMHAMAFEPNPETFTTLSWNLRTNRVDHRVDARMAAVGAESGTAVLKVPLDQNRTRLATLGTPMRYRGWTERTVKLVALDDLEFERLDVLKIDVEGGELDVLRGATDTIERHRPVIIVEASKKNTQQFGYEPDAIWDMLGNLGYDCEQATKNDVIARHRRES